MCCAYLLSVRLAYKCFAVLCMQHMMQPSPQHCTFPSLPRPSQRQPARHDGKRQHHQHQNQKAVRIARQRDAADVHAEEAGDNIDRQRQYGNHG